jgi:hypothetical protein
MQSNFALEQWVQVGRLPSHRDLLKMSDTDTAELG